jgi:hypothetical protein
MPDQSPFCSARKRAFKVRGKKLFNSGTVQLEVTIYFRVEDGTQWTAYVDRRVERRWRDEVVFWFQ